MDQKKTLWIIAAVGAFLLVVLGAAYIMYPKAPRLEQTITRNIPATSKGNTGYIDDGWANPPAPATVPGEMAVNELTVFSENTNVYSFDDSNASTTIDLNALKNDLITQAPPVPAAQDINITVQIKDPEPVAKTTEPAADYYVAKTEPKKTTSAPVVQEKTKVTSTKATASTTSGKSVTVTAKTSAPATKTQYWVQVAAYSSKKGAESARAVLDENKITADIFTYKDNKDNLFYRVRVGPYTTKSEAEYWKSKIIKIDTFAKAESYITSTQTELN